MTLLAVAYLTVQYMVALGETRFLWVLGVVAIAEPFLLTAGHAGIVDFATIVFGVQCVAASSVLALGLTRPPPAPPRGRGVVTASTTRGRTPATSRAG